MRVICDIEADSLTPTKIWCIVCKDVDSGDVQSFTYNELDAFVRFSRSVTCWIGHNFLGFDLWAINNLTAASLDPRRVIDTLVVSRLFNFLIDDGHSLEAWGKRLGKHKIEFNDYSQYTPEMLVYCKQDVEVNYELFKFFEPHILKEHWRSALRTEHDIAIVCREMHDNGFTFEHRDGESLLQSITEKCTELSHTISQSFLPRATALSIVTPRATKFGTLSRSNLRFVTDGDFTPYSDGAPFTRIEWRDFNPSSPKQIVERFNEFGWAPVERTDGHTDAIRELGSIKRKLARETHSMSLNESVTLHERRAQLEEKLRDFEVYGWKVSETNLDTLPDTAPEAAYKLVEWRFLEKRRQTLVEWLSLYNKETGRIHGNFNGLGTWTGRMSHSNPNMANVPSTASKYHNPHLKELAKDYGKRLRSLWSVPSGRRLVGVDAEGIQLRILAHYIHDIEFTTALVSGDKSLGTDAHTLNAIKLGIGRDRRENAKTFIYAFLLGAGIDKVAKILDTDYRGAEVAYRNFLESYPGLVYLKNEVIPNDAARGYFQGIDGRYVKCDSEHLMLAGYLQNGEAVVMKRANLMWRKELRELGVDFKQVNFVHDEWQIEIPDDDAIADLVTTTCKDSLRKVGEELGLRCPLAGSSNVGYSWYDTH